VRRVGFATVEPGSVLEAENLLDLYGEDVRARAFVFDGGGATDLCLRPDLTLAICRHHLSNGGGDAKYVASGPVYRRPSVGETRPVASGSVMPISRKPMHRCSTW